jgi:preprotein translocase subunit SecA
MVAKLVGEHCSGENEDSWSVDELSRAVNGVFGITPAVEKTKNTDSLAESLYDQVEAVITAKENEFGKDVLIAAYRHFYLRQIDRQWIDHLAGMEHLRAGIGLRGYGNRDPKQEYKREGYDMFIEMMNNIKSNVLESTFHVSIEKKEDVQKIAPPKQERRTIEGRGGEGGAPAERVRPHTVKREEPKVGRNDPCPCGSGKKYKKCCGT